MFWYSHPVLLLQLRQKREIYAARRCQRIHLIGPEKAARKFGGASFSQYVEWQECYKRIFMMLLLFSTGPLLHFAR